MRTSPYVDGRWRADDGDERFVVENPATGAEPASLITAEMGKSLTEERAEVLYGAEFLRWFSELAAHSGLGREGGLEGIEEFLEPTTIAFSLAP